MGKILTYVGIALAVAAVLAGIIFSSNRTSSAVNKPPEAAILYNIDDYKKVDPALIGYTEVRQIKPAFRELYGMACDADDKIYVTGDDQLAIFDPAGDEISRIDLDHEAKCVTLSPDQLIYLGLNHTVAVLDRNGKTLRSWVAESESAVITSIAAGERDVFVADAMNKVVLQYDPAGNLLRRIGEKDPESERPGFIIPSFYFDLAIDPDGFLWVVNPGLHTFENYTFEGKLRASWRKTAFDLEGFGGCCNPTHMAILPDGSFVTSEKGLVRVKIHDPTGQFHTVVAAPNQFAEGTVGLDLAVDSRGQILVLDPKTGMIRIFAKRSS